VTRVLLASRSVGKVRELRDLLARPGRIEIVGLDEVGISESPAEEALEVHPTFEANALAKARHFGSLAGLPAIADDSGLEVDALGGAPGTRSRRFAEPDAERGEAQDDANNRLLLRLMEPVADGARTARFRCAAAIVFPDGREEVRLGTLEGMIAGSARGAGGFGYDPLFLVPGEGATLAELSPARKNELSHRSRAIARLADALSDL
jgi:XTP/dITP diphosphohydrolase